MNHPSLSSVKHEVTYRFIGGSPENGILSCGFMRKKSAQKSQIDFVIPYYSCFLLLQGSGEYWDETGARAALTPGSVCQRLPNRQHSTRVDGDGNWLEFYISFGKGVFDSLKSLELVQETVPVGRFADPLSLLPLFHSLLSRMSAARSAVRAAICSFLLCSSASFFFLIDSLSCSMVSHLSKSFQPDTLHWPSTLLPTSTTLPSDFNPTVW